ncbi:MAG TPA: PEP-CTERM sorting domain-containing protein [Candidatus Binatia bacterium]|jgi:subtilisin-like proprotein convertase family protein
MKTYVHGLSITLLAIAAVLGGRDKAAAVTFTFSNTGPITINDNAAATPYPATVTVSGFTAPIADLNVVVNGLSHTFPTDVGILLVGPGNQTVVLMNNTGGINTITNVNLTFDDEAATPVPDPISGSLASGTYRPTNLAPAQNFLSPAPAGPYGSSLSVFDRTSANGVWRLFVEDFSAGDIGSISGGFGLQITVPEPSPLILLAVGLLGVVLMSGRRPEDADSR